MITMKRSLAASLASMALVALLGPSARSQVVSGADRYMGSTQASLGRTNAAITSFGSNYVTPSMGGGSMIGAANASFDRTTANMQSMLANRAATVRGLGESAVYRTSDNLYGVYWQNYYARQAQMRSTYMGMLHGRPIWPVANVYQMQMEDNARRRLQEDARGAHLRRRLDRLDPELPPNPGIFTPDTILNDVPGADLIRRDAARAASERPPASNGRRSSSRGRSPRN